jgi:hypothetical protein
MRAARPILIAVACASLSAADHMNLEEGLPTQLEDAYPIAFRGREIQAHVSYERTGDDKNRVTLEPSVEFGFAPNAQGKITAPFYLGNAEKRGSGTWRGWHCQHLRRPRAPIFRQAETQRDWTQP